MTQPEKLLQTVEAQLDESRQVLKRERKKLKKLAKCDPATKASARMELRSVEAGVEAVEKRREVLTEIVKAKG